MNISDFMSPDEVVARLKAGNKRQALQRLARHAARATDIAERMIFDTLLERERLGSTGVGQGIAIPHGKLAHLHGLHGLFARLETPIDFDAVDNNPVDLIFLLLAPEDAGADHLKALARISRTLRDRAVVEKLRRAKDKAALFALLTEPS